MKQELQKHNIAPLFDSNSKILILGSFPSVKSREGAFFYHHPQNRFWKVLAQVLNQDPPQTIAEKTKLILQNHIALWDVIGQCEITGSDDNSIKNVVPNDLRQILETAKISKIYLNGGKAYSLYQKYMKNIEIEAIKLPSTSPANARYSLEKLCQEWQQIATELNKKDE